MEQQDDKRKKRPRSNGGKKVRDNEDFIYNKKDFKEGAAFVRKPIEVT